MAAATPAVKTTKSAPVAPKKSDGAANLKAAREARERATALDTFAYLGKVKEGVKKLAPQAQNIVNILQAKKGKAVLRGDLVKAMEGVVTSNQPLARILAYYQKQLAEEGYVTWVKAPKAEKPAKAKAIETADADDEGEEEGEE